MRLTALKLGGEIGLATRRDGRLIGRLASHARYPGPLEHLIAGGPSALRQAEADLADGEVFNEASVQFLPPLSPSAKIICVGLNYRDHSAESGFTQPDYPTLFARFSSSLIGHGAPMVAPAFSDTLDFEGELVAIIGTGGRFISKEKALDHIAGYSVFNDGSVREYQFKSPQWTMGKNFDHTGAFGPDFVSADELPPGGRGLRLETRLNGRVVQSANTDDLVFDVATLVSTISEGITLATGDVIVTGTPSGVGHSRSPRLYMTPGDICEVEIEGVGLLRNAIVSDANGAVHAAA